MEETKEGGKEPDSAWNSRVVGMGGEQLSESLLAHGEEWPCTKGNLNGKARTARIQEYPRTVRASTHAIEPPYTERYVWWCERSATQLMGSLLLDLTRYVCDYRILRPDTNLAVRHRSSAR